MPCSLFHSPDPIHWKEHSEGLLAIQKALFFTLLQQQKLTREEYDFCGTQLQAERKTGRDAL